jgi:hypothetical protein
MPPMQGRGARTEELSGAIQPFAVVEGAEEGARFAFKALDMIYNLLTQLAP